MPPPLERCVDGDVGSRAGRRAPALLTLLVGLVSASVAATQEVADAPAPDPTAIEAPDDAPVRVLLIGHSYYYFNNLPVQLAALAESAGHRIEIESLAQPSATLTSHMSQPETWDAIAGWDADFVVLSDNSLLGGRPWRGQLRVALDVEEFNDAVRRLDAAISAAGARTVLFLNWARKFMPWDQRVLNRHYERIAAEVGAIVTPVGPAWRRARARSRRIELYRSDGSHPAPAGTYLAACVLYATIFGESPVGLTGRVLGPDPLKVSQEDVVLVDLSDSDARLLQEAAWSVWTRYQASQRRRKTTQ
jgi:hypothetical protein